MEKLGYIISDRKINNIKDFVGFADDISSVDSAKPVLIVGIKKAKEYCGKNFNILKKKISSNISWTFKKTERRDDFENDIKIFYKICILNILNNINYYYINIIKLKYSSIKKIYNIIFSNEKKYIYICNDMIYLLHKDIIIGFSLRVLQYCGIKPNKIIDRIKSNKSNKIYEEDNPFVKMIKREIVNKEYVVPYFMSIE